MYTRFLKILAFLALSAMASACTQIPQGGASMSAFAYVPPNGAQAGFTAPGLEDF